MIPPLPWQSPFIRGNAPGCDCIRARTIAFVPVCYHSPLRENHRTGEQCSPRTCMASNARRYGYEPDGLKGKWVPLKNTHRRRTAEFQPSSPCKNLDRPPGNLCLLQAKSVWNSSRAATRSFLEVPECGGQRRVSSYKEFYRCQSDNCPGPKI